MGKKNQNRKQNKKKNREFRDESRDRRSTFRKELDWQPDAEILNEETRAFRSASKIFSNDETDRANGFVALNGLTKQQRRALRREQKRSDHANFQQQKKDQKNKIKAKPILFAGTKQELFTKRCLRKNIGIVNEVASETVN